MNQSQHSFAVRNIFETQGEYSRVSIDNATFNTIRGFTPTIPYTTTRNAAGKGVRVFNINGITLMSRYDTETKKTVFFMKRTEAMAHLRTLEQERSSEPTLAVSF